MSKRAADFAERHTGLHGLLDRGYEVRARLRVAFELRRRGLRLPGVAAPAPVLDLLRARGLDALVDLEPLDPAGGLGLLVFVHPDDDLLAGLDLALGEDGALLDLLLVVALL